MRSNNLDLEKKVFEEIKLVVFNLPGDKDQIKFGMNAHKVREVVEINSFDKLPTAYAPYIGIMNLRGMPIPILNMFSVLNDSEYLETNEKPSSTRVIICETLGKTVGIISGPKIKMYEFQDRSITPTTFAHGKVNNEFVAGIIEHESGYIFMLNIESVLDELDEGESEVQHNTKVKNTYKGKRALVVEDSRLYRKKLSIFLEAMGFDVVLAIDGVAGLETLEKDANFDIIFSDIEMPQMNGIEMVRKIKQNDKTTRIPILFHSSISNKELMLQIKSESLGDYITKFDESVILEKLAKIFP